MNLYQYQNHEDVCVRTIEVRESLRIDALVFDTAPDESHPAAVLPRKEVRALYDILGRWLGEDPAPEPVKPGPSLHTERVQEIATDVFTKHVADLLVVVRSEARQEIRNFLTRAVEMGVDR